MPQPPGVTIRGRKPPPAPARHSRNLQAHIVSGPGAGTEGFRNAPSGVRILRHPRKEIRASWKTRSARPDARNRPPRDPAQGTNRCPGSAATEQRGLWESSTKDVASTVGASPEGPCHISAGIPEGPSPPPKVVSVTSANGQPKLRRLASPRHPLRPDTYKPPFFSVHATTLVKATLRERHFRSKRQNSLGYPERGSPYLPEPGATYRCRYVSHLSGQSELATFDDVPCN